MTLTKIGVLETAGTRGAEADRWAAHQFHGPTEFYADYADYDVRIGVPEGWAVVATGRAAEPESGAEGLVWHRFTQRAVHDFAFSTGRRMTALTSTYQPRGSGGPVDLTIFVPRGTEHQEPRWLRIAYLPPMGRQAEERSDNPLWAGASTQWTC